MSVNGKRSDFLIDDLIRFATGIGIKAAKAKQLLSDVSAALNEWPEFAEQAKLPGQITRKISQAHRRELFI